MDSVGTGSYWPWNDRQGRFSALRAACFALVLVPALILAFQAWTHQLGSKPWTQAVHDTGTWALRILVITLAITPLRRILDWNKLIGIRRMLGLSAMAYALGHLALYCIDLAFDWGLILSEIVKRFYLVVGITALIGLVALGVTSTDGMIRRLGSGRWQRLHNIVYVIACLGLFHFALQSKIDVTQPVLLTGLFALLIACRGLNRFKIPLSFTSLALTGLATGLATALAETAWYAFATGASAWLIFQANADIVVYQDWAALRPGHWIALTGLALAVLHLFRKPAPKPERRQRRPAMASEAAGG
ncbi:Protein-methionine-sulfoxide reductase heme-binding subunit MsrQ [Bosea sp. 62]|uniref:sulfite oxidase heme-binding subunit YedZ n=1 Tax=unclassified Bosea (in: a-proteobacteria) TaxID=2653178 RepID=UPI001256FF43|nr:MULTISPECIES: protein-methionine-sulfoxide reductase heme-binding subunit MsrQ [unclassified Bosea (in: a-proteobacteria)]CAD5286738.1 Protein-methionine-sulfoxide reductase heme-binding subunit MsrQ [Bosea sp. 21B]CAD5289237.1 Protein-methionine-sulfoxide reductase heme-binding subunit MsrQ [Bosea sp. 46]CAD5301216.1 Protein-methionine-sulfoxide reductase heme-binding subunit MsrQ [Bosea sp. 7B]VVT60536.1 Protein-methionine-sulfoxide reductase heme-binding subunit MsrQ [Bosea sp. EC-HK365B]